MGVAASDRAALARAALAAAEARTGARRVSLVGVAGGRPDAPVPTTSLLTSERPPLPVPPALAPLLPGGLRRGAVTAVLGSTWLVLGVLAHALVDGTWGAVVGHPDLGLLAAARAGVPLDRLGLVPEPGDRTAEVLAALADGMGAVLVGPRAALPVADARRITARARDRGTALLTTMPWPGAHVVLRASPVHWAGVGTVADAEAGMGRVRHGQTSVVRDGRPGALVDLTLPLPCPVDGPTLRHPVGGPVSVPGSDRPRLRRVG